MAEAEGEARAEERRGRDQRRRTGEQGGRVLQLLASKKEAVREPTPLACNCKRTVILSPALAFIQMTDAGG